MLLVYLVGFFFLSTHQIILMQVCIVILLCFPVIHGIQQFCLLCFGVQPFYHLTQQINVKILLNAGVHGAMTLYLSHLLFDDLNDFSSSNYLFKDY